MNQKAFLSIFIGLIMIFSAFAGVMLLWGNNESKPVTVISDSLETFGVQGRLVNWNVESINDMLELAPESTGAAYWLDAARSENLTDAAKAVLPQSFGLTYGERLYPNNIEKLGAIYFNNTWAEFHWIKPFKVSYEGLVIPYNDFMMIPSSADYSAVMGKPTLFGPQEGLKGVLDVISGGFPTDLFELPQEEKADLQIAVLGSASKNSSLPLPSGFQEFYLGVTANDSNGDYNITARYLNPDSSTEQKIQSISKQYGLSVFSQSGTVELSGTLQARDLKDALTTILKS
ncbi:MAG: hypothetical protein MUO26_10270 [Methanotrichaceae archaeon]|nr:hypothetical protein [Methanotrichaceae archaeon]